MSLPTDADIDEAIRRIALTSDGLLLYRRLQMVLMEVPASADSGALQAAHGRRTFARDLKTLMDSELSKLGQARDRIGHHDPDEPAIVEPAKPVVVDRPGLRRRVPTDYPGNPS